RTRAGVATGVVIVGELVHSLVADNPPIVGETANLAARLQECAQPDTLVIAPSTKRLLGDLFEYRDLGLMSLKGFSMPLRGWRVLGETAIQSRCEALRSRCTPLIGREVEMALLMRHWTEAKGGAGRMVLLSGEPGIGKSRIAVELQERLQNEPHLTRKYF